MKKLVTKFLNMILLTLSIIILIIGFSLSWFKVVEDSEVDIISQEVKVDFVVYFKDRETIHYPSLENGFLDEDNLVILNVVNPEAINYINNLCVDITFSGSLDSLIRIRLFEEFYKYTIIIREDEQVEMGSVIRQELVNYNINSPELWYDYRSTDDYFYFENPLSTNSLDEELTIPFIRGIDVNDDTFPLYINNTPTIIEGYTVTFIAKVDVVQKTRAKEVWNLTKLPWE